MYKSIISGAEFIKTSYMSVGQTTTYFQKYNVVDKNNLYGHQYMTNVWGAYAEGKIMRSKYIKYGISESNFTFTIPLFNGMPKMNGELMYVNANPSLKLKAAPSASSEHLLSINLGTIVLRTEKATKKVDGYYWDKVKTPYGIGYMARNSQDDSKEYLVKLAITPPGDTVIDKGDNNNFTDPDGNNIIYVEPKTTANRLKQKYTTATIVNKEGTEVVGDALVGTGSKIKIDGKEKYTIVKLGDASGDGEVDARDSARILKYSVGQYRLENEFLKAADISKDGEIDARDSARILKYSVGQYNINI